MAIISAGHGYIEATNVMGIVPDGSLGGSQVTPIRSKATARRFFVSDAGRHGPRRGAGAKLAERLNVVPGIDSIQLLGERDQDRSRDRDADAGHAGLSR